MNNIKKLVIRGLKVFKNFEIEFNNDTNIIIGDNESGKSTIIEAIEIVLNKKYVNYDKYIIEELINKENKKIFEEKKEYNLLPKIEIYAILNLDNSCQNNFDFYGDHGICKNTEEYGIKFLCQFDEKFKSELLPIINEGKIPYEYYEMTWETFKGDSYNSLKKPFKYLSIDNSRIDSFNTFNYYNKTLFHNKFDDIQRMKFKNSFRRKINDLLDEIGIAKIDSNRSFGIDNKKVILENILSVLEEDIQIENRGKGKENLIKTEIALSKASSDIEVITIEEPENHLSHTNLRKMLDNIRNSFIDDKGNKRNIQLIVTTHNSLIVSSLNISNVLWINNKEKADSLNNLSKDKKGKEVSLFFEKADNLNILQFLIADKVILVEGATEYMLIQKIFKDIYPSETLEKNKIDIISCNGVSYMNYLIIAESMHKRVAVLTDNDYKTNTEKINEINEYNAEAINTKIFTDNNIENWTWEVALYNLNKETLEENIKLRKGANYFVNGEDFGKYLGKMLNNKTDIAYMIIEKDIKLNYPEYIKDCFKWIKQ